LNSLSNQEKELITGEIKAAVQSLIRGCETLDMDLAFEVFEDSPEFLMMGTDGSLCDYDTYVKNNVEYLVACSSFKLTTFNEEIRILNCETAVFSWTYQAEATLLNGDKDIVENAGASFIFNKVDDKWKVVYYHESSTPPARIIGF
jgi:hypothetical protein